jgi:hypothetical protein
LFHRQRTIRIGHFKDDVGFKVKESLNIPEWEIEEKPHSGGQAFEVPNVGNWRSELDIAHPFTTDTLLGNFNATSVTDGSSVLNPFVFSARTFPILLGTENRLTE